MKKSVLIIISLILSSLTLHAQLKVDSLGRVGIGTSTPTSLLSVGGGNSNYLSYFNANNKNGIYINNNAKTGINISNKYSYQSTTIGIDINPGGGYSQTYTYGLRSITGTSNSKNISVWGGIAPSPYSPSVNIGIYGSSIPSDNIVYTGTYAGYFNGDVRVTGSLFANVLLSNAYNGNNMIEEVIDNDSPLFTRLNQIGVIRLIDNNNNILQPVSSSCKDALVEAGYEIPDEMQSAQAEQSKIHYGLDVEMLKKNFPELVNEDDNGNVAINYIEMVPLLLQSIKELNAKIEELNGGGSTASKNFELASGISQAEATDILSLSQNVPNPFSTATSISVNVPESTNNAAIFIYDMSGKQIKQIDINGRGKTSISVSAEGLNAGMYLYTLIADGRVISTKRMILTK